MRVRTELRLVAGFEDEPYHFLKELIAPGRDAEWAQSAVLLGHVDPSDRRPAIAFMTQCVNELFDLPERHGVYGFVGRSWGNPLEPLIIRRGRASVPGTRHAVDELSIGYSKGPVVAVHGRSVDTAGRNNVTIYRTLNL